MNDQLLHEVDRSGTNNKHHIQAGYLFCFGNLSFAGSACHGQYSIPSNSTQDNSMTSARSERFCCTLLSLPILKPMI